MRIALSGRNVVCLVPMPPGAFSFPRLEEELELDRPSTQVVNPQLALGEYERFRVVVVEGRLQLDLGAVVDREEIRRTVSAVLAQVEPFQVSALGFNGIAQIQLEGDESDPTTALLDVATAGQRLNAESVRGGVKLVYAADGASVTLTVEPEIADDHRWLASVNRHHEGMPDGEHRDAAIQLFAQLDTELARAIRALFNLPEDEQHAA